MRIIRYLLVIIVLAALTGASQAYPLGVGAYGGYDVPVLQTDVGNGTMWGVGVRGNIWHFVHGMVFVRGTSQNDKDETLDFGNNQTETVTYKGGTLTGFGLNVLLARKEPANVWPYGLLGVSTNNQKFGDGFKGSKSLSGWCFGGGMGINLYNRALYLDVNTSLLVMPFHDNKASRKTWQTMAGIQYFIPIMAK